MKLVPAILALAFVGGCTQQSKQEYSQAGSSLKNAAQETGKAIVTDTKAAGKAAQNAADTTKNKTEHAKDHPPVVKVKAHK
jgi:hypothetical protein